MKKLLSKITKSDWLVIVIAVLAMAGMWATGKYEYSRGLETGYGKALDTVDVILKERVENTPPRITELKLDTVRYYLYKKLAHEIK